MQLPDVNLDAISDPAIREVVQQLLNIIETLAAENVALRLEVQQLRDENARLKGGSGKPDIKPSVQPPATDHSSEAERQTRTPAASPRKTKPSPSLASSAVWLTLRACLRTPASTARASISPKTSSSRSKSSVSCVRNGSSPPPIRPSSHRCPQAIAAAFLLHPEPVPALGYDTTNVSQPALLHFLRTMGVSIGAGTIARLLGDTTGCWAEEAEAIHQAGLASGPWVATDQTSTRVDGQNEVCHVVGNRLFTSYHTRPGGTRQDVLAVLWGQELRFRLNDEAVRWLEATSLPASLLNRLVLALPWERELTAELQEHLTAGRGQAGSSAAATGRRRDGSSSLPRPKQRAHGGVAAERRRDGV